MLSWQNLATEVRDAYAVAYRLIIGLFGEYCKPEIEIEMK